MFRAYKMRIFPTEEQKVLIAKTFGCCRWYWNQALHDNIEYYKENGNGKITTPAKYKTENAWLKEVDSSDMFGRFKRKRSDEESSFGIINI